MHEWVAAAHEHSGLSRSELSRRLVKALGKTSEDRSLISKMTKAPGDAGTKARRTSLADLVALSEITGYPIPDELRDLARAEESTDTFEVPLLSKVSASAFREQDGVRDADIDRHIKVSHLPRGKWFALTVEGTSMDRVAPDGSIIIVNQADDILLDGKAYVFSLDDGAATFKQYRLTPEPMLTPYSWHPEHYAMPVGDKDLYVFGRVRRVITDL